MCCILAALAVTVSNIKRPAGQSLTQYLGLPLHPGHRDSQQQDDCDGADDADVVDWIRHGGVYALQHRKWRKNTLEFHDLHLLASPSITTTRAWITIRNC